MRAAAEELGYVPNRAARNLLAVSPRAALFLYPGAGHLFADQFDGSGGLDNIVSQARDLNQGAWKDMEGSWADAIRSGKKVEVFTEVHYGGGSRPTGFTVTYEIDGRRVIQTFDQ
mgnify:CR=1 FL=1